MANKVEICNMALGQCRASFISSLDDESNEAEQCNIYYEPALKFLLEDNPWKFSHIISALALHEEEPQEWVYSYAYPSDCLKIRRLIPNIFRSIGNANNVIYRLEYYNLNYNFIKDYKVPYETGINSDNAQAIWTDEVDCYISYTKFQNDPTRYSSTFVMAFMHYLAALIAVPVTGRKEGSAIMKEQFQLYNATVLSAIANNHIENYRGSAPDSDMINVRG